MRLTIVWRCPVCNHLRTEEYDSDEDDHPDQRYCRRHISSAAMDPIFVTEVTTQQVLPATPIPECGWATAHRPHEYPSNDGTPELCHGGYG